MNINIILTHYLLTFMYGDRVFQDSLLLTREVIKKAYTEGLYYISKEEYIDELYHEPNKKRTILVFSGVPSFQEICMNYTPHKTLSALKINLPYEILASFEYLEKEEVLQKKIDLKKEYFTKVNFHLCEKEGNLFYSEEESSEDSFPEMEICQNLKKELENYSYAIHQKLDYLRQLLLEFSEKEQGRKLLEKEDYLQLFKDSYEELTIS